MNHKIARRRFLQTAGATVLAGAARGFAAPGGPEAEPQGVYASEAKMPRLFSGCCAYSYGRYFKDGTFLPGRSRHPHRGGQMTIESFIRTVVELRLDAVDMTGYYFESIDPAYLAGLRHYAYKQAMAFSGAACGVRMVEADLAKRAQSLAGIKKWVDVTDYLGAPHLRVFAGRLPPGATLRQAIGWVVDTMKAATDYSGKKGIMVGIEDHVGITQSADTCLEIMHRVNSPYAGINLDITHFIPTPTEDRYAQIKMCIPYATNVHIRDRFDDRTPIDMDRVWRMFADAGHKGYMSAEYEAQIEGEDAMTGMPKLAAKIRALNEKYSSV
jgi:sugar phosphate isomerase/epimerase